MPAGLSTSSSPPGDFSARAPSSRSVGGLVSSTRRGGVLLLDVREKRLDARRPGDRVVFLELDFRSDAQLQLAGDARAEVRSYAFQSLERSGFLGLAAEHAHVNPGVAQIGSDIRARDGDEA